MEEYQKLLGYLSRTVAKWEGEQACLREQSECEPFAARSNSLRAKANTYGRCISEIKFALRKNGIVI